MDVVIDGDQQAPGRACAFILASFMGPLRDSDAPDLEQSGPWFWVVMLALPLAPSQLGGWKAGGCRLEAAGS